MQALDLTILWQLYDVITDFHRLVRQIHLDSQVGGCDDESLSLVHLQSSVINHSMFQWYSHYPQNNRVTGLWRTERGNVTPEIRTGNDRMNFLLLGKLLHAYLSTIADPECQPGGQDASVDKADLTLLKITEREQIDGPGR